MRIFIPEYYHQFQCIADACPDSCCKEWEVDVDEASAAFYRSLPGELGQRLRQVLKDTPDGTVMVIEDGRCPMWRRDGLCRIQAELGHDALSRVCREFPRLRHDYGDFVELGLELSCPEAARLILTGKQTTQVTTHPGGDAPEYDTEAMSLLRQSRETALTFLSSASLPSNQALAVLLLYAHQVQNWLDGGDPAELDPEACLALAEKHAGKGDWQLLVDFFGTLEILTPQWRALLDAPAGDDAWPDALLKLAGYFIGRYWLQAVSDYDLISRVKLAVTSCMLVRYLGGPMVSTAQLYSKEIENDPDNLEAILDAAYTQPALTDLHLLSLLLNG